MRLRRWNSRIILLILSFSAVFLTGMMSTVSYAEEETYSEMQRISKQVNGVQLDYYLVEPDQAGTYPAVILFCGMGGISKYEDNLLNYANKWMKSKYLDPVVFIAVILPAYSGDIYWKDFIDRKEKGKSKMEYLLDGIDDGSVSSKIDRTAGISVTGYSMGGCGALYTGVLFRDRVINVGCLSPSYMFYDDSPSYGWFRRGEEDQMIFTDSPDRHLFMAASKVENDGGCYAKMNLLLGAIEAPFETKVYETGAHSSPLFFKEIFNFLYYVQQDEIPDSDIVTAAMKGIPKKSEEPEIKTGWVKDGQNWTFYNTEGKLLTGQWLKWNGKWYYFDNKGIMQTGWLSDNGKWYFLTSAGSMKTGWMEYKGSWYFFGTNGVMCSGWKKIGSKWYFFKSGAMSTGWQKLGGKWYFFGEDGAMRTGWMKSGGKWYYFGTDGAMFIGSKKIGSRTYKFDSGGVCQNP